MTASVACPPQCDLERLAQGQVWDDEAERLGQHVLECSACAELLNSIQQADPLLFELTRVAGQDVINHLDDPTAAVLVERLVGAPPSGSASATPSGSTTETAGMPQGSEPLPNRLGRYKIIDRLGAGGMGVVCRAHDPQLRRDVAIKVPSFGGPAEARTAARQRFMREARAAAAVRHPNICPIYDVGEDDGRPYVVMALVEGESLADRFRRQGRFENADEAIALVAQVADALAAIHAAAIVHRDLKPGNILLDHTGQPLLADFGLARVEDHEQLTCAGALLGTPAYLSPEQAYPELGPVGPWSDQYSLGVVLYQLLTGRRPFEASSLSALIHQLGTKPVPPPSQHRTDLDPALERVLTKALARQPRNRFTSVAEFAQALRACRRAATAPALPGREAQYRNVTLLSCGCDVFESPAILELFDPEEQHEVLVSFQQLCREVAMPLAGTVVKSTDRGLLICFGIPFAMECASRRAVTAGLNLLDRMDSFNARLAEKDKTLQLSARIAVHSGRAVVSESNSPTEPLTIVGQVLPVVDQLEQLTAPDTVLISDDTRQRLRGFVECVGLGGLKLKGVAGEMPIWRVQQQRAPGVCTEERPTGLVPLIGREHEVALLEERWRQTLEGVGQVVLLVGPAGIGKSRQVRVLKEYVAGQCAGSAATIIEWPCSPVTENSGLHPAIDCFHRLLESGPHDDPARKLDKLAAHLDSLGLGGAEAVALLAGLLSISLEERYPALGMSPARQKEKTFDLLLNWLREQAARQPVLFIVEDLHWADPTTLEFVEFLVGQSQGAALLTLLTFRPEFVPPWKNVGQQTQVSLDRLNRRLTGELAVFRSGLRTIPQTLLDHIVERSDGVPLFVEEITAMLVEAGTLHEKDGRGQLADDYDPRAVPASLQDLLMARLDRMSSKLEIVQLAAAIGREFSYELLHAAGPWDEQVLQQELAKLVEAALLFVRGRPPGAQYQFKHALIQDAAYQTLLKKKRQQFHLRIAEALEQRFPETCASQPELLAHHFTEGNAILKGVTYWDRAGQRAQQRSAAEEAVGHFTRGLELIRTLPESLERHAHEINLHISLGVALAAARGFGVPELEVTYARAHALCTQTGLTDQVFPAMFGRLRYCMNRSMYASVQQLAEEMLRFAERGANVGYLVSAHGALGLSLVLQGKHTEALPHFEHVLAVEPTRDLRLALHRYVLIDQWVVAHSFLSWALWLQGYPDRAAVQSCRALRVAEGLDHPISLACALCHAPWYQRFTRDLPEIREAAARALALGTEKGFVSVVARARILEAWTMAGLDEGALSAIRQGLEDLRLQSMLGDRNEMLLLLADACGRVGLPQDGLEALAEALEFAEATGERLFQAEMHRIAGELLLQRDSTASKEAEACFHQALDVARRQQARFLELRAAVSLARLWRQQGKSQAAGDLVEQVYSGFTEGFQTHDLQTAHALLAECRSGQN